MAGLIGRFGDWFRVLVTGAFSAQSADRTSPPIFDYWVDDANNVFYDDNNIPFFVESVISLIYWVDDGGNVFIDDNGDPFETGVPPPYDVWFDDTGSIFIDDHYNVFG